MGINNNHINHLHQHLKTVSPSVFATALRSLYLLYRPQADSQSLLPFYSSCVGLSAPTSSSFSTETIHEGVAPLISSSNSVEVPDSYIVVFKKHVTEAAASSHHSWVKGTHAASESTRT